MGPDSAKDEKCQNPDLLHKKFQTSIVLDNCHVPGYRYLFICGTGAWVLPPAFDVMNNVVLILWRKHVAINNIIIEGMKLRRNRRLANFTKSAITIGILLPRVPLHYCCLPYTPVVPFLALTLQRSAFIRNTDRPNFFFFLHFSEIGQIKVPLKLRKWAMFSASTHVWLVETPTHYLQSTRNTVPHYPHEFYDNKSQRRHYLHYLAQQTFLS